MALAVPYLFFSQVSVKPFGPMWARFQLLAADGLPDEASLIGLHDEAIALARDDGDPYACFFAAMVVALLQLRRIVDRAHTEKEERDAQSLVTTTLETFRCLWTDDD